MAFVTRRQLGPLFRSRGYPIGDSTVTKITLPSRDCGPPSAGFFGRTRIWDEEVALDWAKANLTPEAKPFDAEKPQIETPTVIEARRRKQIKASEKERPDVSAPGREQLPSTGRKDSNVDT